MMPLASSTAIPHMTFQWVPILGRFLIFLRFVICPEVGFLPNPSTMCFKKNHTMRTKNYLLIGLFFVNIIKKRTYPRHPVVVTINLACDALCAIVGHHLRQQS